MELEEILKLIDRVSDSRLTAFSYDCDGVKLYMECGEAEKTEMAMTNVCAEPAGKDVTEVKSEGQEGVFIKSPLVGTFYAAPSQEAEPFVAVGDRVKKGQVVAIVEAMKLMNEIESDFDGEIAEIYVKNGEAVEYGQPLFRIK